MAFQRDEIIQHLFKAMVATINARLNPLCQLSLRRALGKNRRWSG